MMKLAQWLHAGLTGKREAQQQTSRPVDGILLDDDGDAITLDGHVMHVDADGCLLMGDLDHLLGASTEVVAALPRHTLESTDSLEEGALCTICQSGYQSGDTLTTLICGHRYHDECLRPWLGVSNKCPLCELPVS
mmetsp:Transcript_82481/g.256155  ORF Transcript_82481/g.256155 Transcript_82481/m.256155 type:complete len:135 (-) Transcript_82481:445-849(-)